MCIAKLLAKCFDLPKELSTKKTQARKGRDPEASSRLTHTMGPVNRFENLRASKMKTGASAVDTIKKGTTRCHIRANVSAHGSVGVSKSLVQNAIARILAKININQCVQSLRMRLDCTSRSTYFWRRRFAMLDLVLNKSFNHAN